MWFAGERGDWRGEPLDADDVRLECARNVRVGSVCVWGVCVRMGLTRATGVEFVR